MKKKRSENRSGSVKGSLVSLVFLCLLFFLFSVLNVAQGEESGKMAKYPSRPIRIIIPAAAGGSLGREIMTLAPFLEKYLAVKTVIEYLPGAGGIIAYNKFTQGKPDGYTLAYFSNTSAIPLELTRKNARFSVKDFSSIAAWNRKTFVLLASPDKWQTFSDFLRDAKKQTLSMAGTGGASEMQYRLMEMALGVKLNWVPYASSGEGGAAVAGKHVDTLLTFTVSALPLVRAGKLKALALFSRQEDPFLPGAPTFKSLGHEEVPTLVAYAMFASPPNTPKGIVGVLEKAIQRTTENPEFMKIAETNGSVIDFKSTAELNEIISNDYKMLDPYKKEEGK